MAVVAGKSSGNVAFKIFGYALCIFLAIISLFPFVIMIVNSTRSTTQIQQHAVSLIPSTYFFKNLDVLLDKSFDPLKGFFNSLIISSCSTICTVYFSTMTAYAVVAYDWKLRKPFFTLIMCVLMIPAQVSSIGFYKMVYGWGMSNNYIPLIIPAIAAPATVFFMRQFMVSSLPLEIIDAARIDGSKEFATFNRIAMPLLKPAVATQCIFAFIGSWNNLYTPSMILSKQDKYTLPMFIQLLRGERFRSDYGIIYVGLVITVLPIFIVYFALSKYIIAGVALGGVKE